MERKKSTKALQQRMEAIGHAARSAAQALGMASTKAKNKALLAAAGALRDGQKNILEANAKDMAAARKNGISGAFLDRLQLDEKRIEAMARGLEEIAALPDPVGRELARWQRPNGLDIARVSVPLGVIGVIYEARPNVTADAGALCLKAGNASILRSGSESFRSACAILECLQAGLKEAALPEAAIQLVPTADRDAVGILLRMAKYIDVIVPRGGKGLIQYVIEESRIPLLQHLEGNCHTYIHCDADVRKAVSVTVNAKMRRPGICGATESLVIDESLALVALPKLVDALAAKGCEMRGDKKACSIDMRITPAVEADWDTEYLDAVLSVKVVKNLDEAITFIGMHHSRHTDAIITENRQAAERFLREMDSAIVLHNASTQFADGGEFGMGAEIGIATGKLHARGPVGVEQLTTFKYMVRGNGHIRD